MVNFPYLCWFAGEYKAIVFGDDPTYWDPPQLTRAAWWDYLTLTKLRGLLRVPKRWRAPFHHEPCTEVQVSASFPVQSPAPVQMPPVPSLLLEPRLVFLTPGWCWTWKVVSVCVGYRFGFLSFSVVFLAFHVFRKFSLKPPFPRHSPAMFNGQTVSYSPPLDPRNWGDCCASTPEPGIPWCLWLSGAQAEHECQWIDFFRGIYRKYLGKSPVLIGKAVNLYKWAISHGYVK